MTDSETPPQSVNECEISLPELQDPERPPTYLAIGDIHGASDKFEALIRHGLGIPAEMEITAENIGILCEKNHIDKILITGDLLDRGPDPVGTFRLTKEIMKSGKGKFIIGNHDLWAMANMLGIHIPNDGQSKEYWAKIFAAQINHAKEWQEKFWDENYNGYVNMFEANYGVSLRGSNGKEEGKDLLNYPEKYAATKNTHINEDAELRAFWAEMLGRNVEILVYTGLRDVESMSLDWWKDKLSKAEELAKRYSDDALLQLTLDEIRGIIEIYDKNLTAQVKEYGEDYLTVDQMMAGHYKTIEWWAFDWIRHKGWGSLDGEGLLWVLNELYGENLDYSNYYDSEIIQEFTEFYRENFSLYEVDDYGNTLLHGMLPIDNRGKVSIGRVDENGGIVTEDENGERIEGLYYKGEHYTGKDIFKGFDAIAEDIRSFDPQTQPISDIREALTLINAIYADETTIIKPKMIAKNLVTLGRTALGNDGHATGKSDSELLAIGLGMVAEELGISIIICGHNTIDKLESAGIKGIQCDDTGRVRLVSIDGGMSPKFNECGMYIKYSGVGETGAEVFGYSGKNTPIESQTSIESSDFFTNQHREHYASVVKKR